MSGNDPAILAIPHEQALENGRTRLITSFVSLAGMVDYNTPTANPFYYLNLKIPKAHLTYDRTQIKKSDYPGDYVFRLESQTGSPDIYRTKTLSNGITERSVKEFGNNYLCAISTQRATRDQSGEWSHHVDFGGGMQTFNGEFEDYVVPRDPNDLSVFENEYQPTDYEKESFPYGENQNFPTKLSNNFVLKQDDQKRLNPIQTARNFLLEEFKSLIESTDSTYEKYTTLENELAKSIDTQNLKIKKIHDELENADENRKINLRVLQKSTQNYLGNLLDIKNKFISPESIIDSMGKCEVRIRSYMQGLPQKDPSEIAQFKSLLEIFKKKREALEKINPFWHPKYQKKIYPQDNGYRESAVIH